MPEGETRRSSVFSLETVSVGLKDDGYALLILKILGLICDGQNKVLQVASSYSLQIELLK